MAPICSLWCCMHIMFLFLKFPWKMYPRWQWNIALHCQTKLPKLQWIKLAAKSVNNVQLEWQQNTCWNAKDSMIIYTIPNDEKEIVYWFTHYLCCRQPKHIRIWLLSCICIWYTIVIIVHCDMDTVTICIHIISYTNKNMTLWLWYQSICQSLQLHNMISGT